MIFLKKFGELKQRYLNRNQPPVAKSSSDANSIKIAGETCKKLPTARVARPRIALHGDDNDSVRLRDEIGWLK